MAKDLKDLDEAGHDFTNIYTWDDGFPGLDMLFLEWRWSIPGRNNTPCETLATPATCTPSYTLICDEPSNAASTTSGRPGRKPSPG